MYIMKNKYLRKKKGISYHVFSECLKMMCQPIFLNFLTQFAEELLLLYSAHFLGTFADAVFQLKWNAGFKNVAILAMCVLAAALFVPGIGLCSDFVMLKKALRHDNLIFGHYMDKDTEKAQQLNCGEVQYELEDAPNTLRIQQVVFIGKMVTLPAGMGYLLYQTSKISLLLTLLMFFLAAIRVVIPIFLRKRNAEYDIRVKEYYAKQRAYETDITANPGILRLFGIEKPMIQRLNRMYLEYHTKTEKGSIVCQVLSQQCLEFTDKFIRVLLLAVGAVMVAEHMVTPGQLASMLVYLSVTLTLFGYMGEIIHDYPLLKNALERVSVFCRDEECTDGESIQHFDCLTGREICFAYGEKQVLNKVSFSISRGEKICFVGENGCGKSTLGKMITGSILSYGGQLAADGIDLKHVCRRNWRRLIAYAPQTPYLFRTTVRENIAMGDPYASYDEISRLMEMFSILPLAERELSSEFDLSGGECQKISVARALLKKAPLLILDEPTNHMDQKSVCALANYIEETDQTVIVISHDQVLRQVTREIKILPLD